MAARQTNGDHFDAEAWVHRFETRGGSVSLIRGEILFGIMVVDRRQLGDMVDEVAEDPARRAALEAFVRARHPAPEIVGARCAD